MKRLLLVLLGALPFSLTPACGSTTEDTGGTVSQALFAIAGQLELASQDPLLRDDTRVKLAEASDGLQVIAHAVRAGSTVDDMHSAVDAFLAVAQQVKPLLEEEDQQALGYILQAIRLVNDIVREHP